VLCVASHARAPRVVAFGCSDRALRLWDTRGKPGSDALAVSTHGAHGGWVSAVSW
jgi:ribosome biogenesis protein YTM1